MKLILLLQIIIYFPIAYAFDSCNEKDPKLFFANGMFNSYDAAIASADALSKIVPSELTSALPVELAYNLNEGALSQLLQVARQKSSELTSHFWRYLGDMSLAPDSFQKMAIDILFKIDMLEYERDADLRRHIELYNKTLQSAKSVVVVAHSQGNLYALASLNSTKLIPNTNHRVELLSVATPLDGGFKETTYTTLAQDQIMNAVRVITGGFVLAANTKNTRSTLSGHQFIEDYLNGDYSRKKISSQLTAFLKKDPPTDWGGTGIEDPTYLHSSLIPFWKYFNRLISSPEMKLSRAQCLALRTFSFIYDLWGEECSERSLNRALKVIDSCRSTWLNQRNKYTNLNCGVTGDDFLTPSDSIFRDQLEVQHPECHFVKLPSKNDSITTVDIEGAKELLINPPNPIEE